MPEPRKILIIRMSSIGDVILTTPVIRQLRETFPDAQIDFLIRREFAEVLRANPHISNLIEIDVRKKGALSLEKLRIRATGYDVILDLQGNLRSFWLRLFSGAKSVLKMRKNKVLRHLLVNYKINWYTKIYSNVPSVAEKYLRAAAPLGTDIRDTKTELHLSPEIRKATDTRWQNWRENGIHVLMAPGARHFTKRWLPENYAALIRRLYADFGWRTLLVGGPDERDICAEILAAAGADCTENIAGELSLTETFGAISQTPLFISNDSGLMHAAAAFAVPQIAIFGSTTRELGFFPINPNAAIVENSGLNCRPCSHIGKATCPKGHFRCMREISPEMVLESVAQLAGVSSKTKK